MSTDAAPNVAARYALAAIACAVILGTLLAMVAHLLGGAS